VIPALDPRSRRPIDWAALLEDPALVAALPAEEQDRLYARVAALEAALRAALLTQDRNGPVSAAEPDRAVLVDEAGRLLGMTKDFLYRHWRKLGGYRDDDGHVKFSLSTIQRHLRTRRP
jgi:hypothetical protein